MSALKNVSEADVQTLLEGFTVQGLQGLTLFTLNAFIVVVVLFHRLLRHEKEYLIVAGMASCDTLRGLAMLVTGLGRNIAIRFGGGIFLTSRWQCFIKPWNLLFTWSDPLYAYGLVLVSIDRLFAVTFPLLYFTLSASYAWKMLGGLYLFIFGHFIVSAVLSFIADDSHLPTFPSYCFFSSQSDHPIYQRYLVLVRIIPPAISVLIYVLVAIRLVQHFSKINGISEQQLQAKMRAARRITVTLGLSCLLTLVTHVIPVTYQYWLVPYLGAPGWATIYHDVYLLNNMNPLLHIFIYLIRQKDIRRGLIMVFRGRQLQAGMSSSVGPQQHSGQSKPVIVRSKHATNVR